MIKSFFAVHHDLKDFLKDVAIGLALVAVAFLALYLYAGTWPPILSITSGSMSPHMERGDLVIIQGLEKGDVHTYEGPESVNYSMFGEAGDVIVYRPYGFTNVTPVIHRAIRFVHKGDPMWGNGPAAPWDGYITLGDNNNDVVDQNSNVCLGEPVKSEWILGTARFRVPYVGYIRALLPF
jgi:signal peptidase I